MKLPFSTKEFLYVFKDYNQAVFPAQIGLYLLVIIAIYLVYKPNSLSGKIISFILAFLWLWMGIVYHLIFFTSINKAAYGFGGLFILQGLSFLGYGVFQNELQFSFRRDIYGVMGIVFIVFALIVYPVLGCVFGHVYPASPSFGVPCPTTIFTFGMLLLLNRKCPVMVLLIPILWSMIGFTAAFLLGIKEDIALIIAGTLTFYLLIFHRKVG